MRAIKVRTTMRYAIDSSEGHTVHFQQEFEGSITQDESMDELAKKLLGMHIQLQNATQSEFLGLVDETDEKKDQD